MVVAVASAFSSAETDDMAAAKIAAMINPITPIGMLATTNDGKT